MSEPTYERRAGQGPILGDTVQSLAVMAAGLPELRARTSLELEII